MNQEILAQIIDNYESELQLSQFSQDMQPKDIISAMRDKLPPHEQKIAELWAKLEEVTELLDDMQSERA